jgi:uncharacterized membrane protein
METLISRDLNSSMMEILERFRGVILLGATLTMGLTAGLFFAYSCSVMPALAKADDRTFVEAMQRINVAILNSWFMTAFMGALLLTGAAGVLFWRGEARSVLPWIVAAFVLYFVGVILVTSGISVPLNNKIAAAGKLDHIHHLAAVRHDFESRWVPWNTVRAVANTAAFGCLVWALVAYGRVSRKLP